MSEWEATVHSEPKIDFGGTKTKGQRRDSSSQNRFAPKDKEEMTQRLFVRKEESPKSGMKKK